MRNIVSIRVIKNTSIRNKIFKRKASKIIKHDFRTLKDLSQDTFRSIVRSKKKIYVPSDFFQTEKERLLGIFTPEFFSIKSEKFFGLFKKFSAENRNLRSFEKIKPFINQNKDNLLQNLLTPKHYHTIKWGKIVRGKCNKLYVDRIYNDLIEKASMFSRIKCVNERYGRYPKWASEMQSTVNNTLSEIKANKPFNDVAYDIAEKMKAITKSENRTNVTSKYHVHTFVFHNKFKYSEYFDRLKNVAKDNTFREKNYPSIFVSKAFMNDLTSGEVHINAGEENRLNANKNMVSCYKKLLPLVNKVSAKKKLSPEEIKFAKGNIAEIYYNFANSLPYVRGTASIADCMTKGLYKALDFKPPVVKEGIGLDLEAMTSTFTAYKRNWDNFFEKY